MVRSPLHGTRRSRRLLNFAHVSVVYSGHLPVVPGDRDGIPTRFSDNAAIGAVALPVNAGTLLEGLGFVDGHCCSCRCMSIAWCNSDARVLFGPHCNCGCNCGHGLLNRPFILTPWDDDVAGGLGPTPVRAKTLRRELPRAVIFVTGMRERLAGHPAVRRKGHFELGAARRGGAEGLAVEEGCPDVAWRHGLRRKGGARYEENVYDGECSCAHQKSINNTTRTTVYTPACAGSDSAYACGKAGPPVTARRKKRTLCMPGTQRRG